MSFTDYAPPAEDEGEMHHEGVQLKDFYAYMPQHRYIFAPTRELWPAASVNARIPPVDDRRTASRSRPSTWLDQNQPVEQMTWCPGEPMLIRDRLIAEGGWIERPGCTIFNLYRPPTCCPAIPATPSPGSTMSRTVYPDDAEHIFRWLAHRVQRPAEKINHALLLGGAPGIGKDTLLHPVKLCGRPLELRRGDAGAAARPLQRLHQERDPAHQRGARPRRDQPLSPSTST